jgi:hypothetical protein
MPDLHGSVVLAGSHPRIETRPALLARAVCTRPVDREAHSLLSVHLQQPARNRFGERQALVSIPCRNTEPHSSPVAQTPSPNMFVPMQPSPSFPMSVSAIKEIVLYGLVSPGISWSGSVLFAPV